MGAALQRWFAHLPRRPRSIAWDELSGEDFPADQRHRLASSWATRAGEERVALHAFAELAGELARQRVDATLLGGLGRVVADEARHVELCTRVARIFGADDVERLPRRVAPDPGRPARERGVLVLLTSLCLAESWSATLFGEELARVEHPVLRAVEEEILAEEVTHGRLGLAWLDDEWMQLPMTVRLPVENQLAITLGQMEARQPASRRALFDRTMPGVILPRLQQAGVRALQAWERRSAP